MFFPKCRCQDWVVVGAILRIWYQLGILAAASYLLTRNRPCCTFTMLLRGNPIDKVVDSS